MGRSKRIASYVKRHGVDRPLELNVMVQEMCPYDLCGVLYTANPAGVLSERVITVGGDTCNATLDPDGTSNTYYYNADGYAYLVRNDDRYLLDEPTTEALSSVADTLKTALSKDVRVDFCVRGGRVYVLQVDTVEEPSRAWLRYTAPRSS
jgi:pyruvate,water dikinase